MSEDDRRGPSAVEDSAPGDTAPGDSAVAYSVVIPTVGRPSLERLLGALASATGPRPHEIVVVDDRPGDHGPLQVPTGDLSVRLLTSGGRGPAAARNVGWRAAASRWIAFLDDDVLVAPTWFDDLAADLKEAAAAAADDPVGASQARIVVPLPTSRPPDDDERRTAALAGARWITADMAYRRSALQAVGGFDERFPRAFREDADLALRVIRAGYRIVDGARVTTHPPGRGTMLTSVRAQAGNADNALMRRKFGPHWRHEIGEGPGRMRGHVLATAAGSLALALGLVGKRRAAVVAGALWAGSTVDFAVRRILPGPRTPREVFRMALTSVLIPPVACGWRLRGEFQVRRAERERPAAVLFDRDDTIIVDVPYLSDPDLVRPVPGAVELLGRLRAHGVPIGVISNQSGVAKGLISPERLAAVNSRVEEVLGPFDTWQVCPHDAADGCECRKPHPTMVRRAAEELGVDVRRCVLIGDTGADVDAALTAGARAVLVPTTRTLPEEVAAAHRKAAVAPTLVAAVALAMGDRR
ncbi:HAD-IIIA family hydrolase [Rhodococcus oxybenzonivorans]|uniref:HAD-IIIA family hydrolase n=1 Tax=Rhodococcus TaxID=1827 RepID=UPI0013203AE0|nr:MULTISPECIES: HAD-IIIA family hydrolase [Rhodococcus]MDV7351655.1 HAD-IIIA family hydrolase [Rhodococcus oxybenzonivorans]QHE69535.1 HAD-superfamily hydrolase subfamily IIIA [Rhodococcus sp. WAY2]